MMEKGQPVKAGVSVFMDTGSVQLRGSRLIPGLSRDRIEGSFQLQMVESKFRTLWPERKRLAKRDRPENVVSAPPWRELEQFLGELAGVVPQQRGLDEHGPEQQCRLPGRQDHFAGWPPLKNRQGKIDIGDISRSFNLGKKLLGRFSLAAGRQTPDLKEQRLLTESG